MKALEAEHPRLRRLRDWLLPLLVGGAALAVYLQTLLPSTGWGDIARFQYVARVWGIPHRFGYPLYIAVSRLFGALPVGDLAYRINLMSALFAALAVIMVYLLVVLLSGSRLGAVAAALAFAFSRAFWGQAVVAEVYSLNAFLIGAVLFILLAWQRSRKPAWLYLGIGLYALSFGNHMTVVTLVPAVLYLVLATEPRTVLHPKRVLSLAGLVFLGTLQYLYVILRAQQQPLLNELGPFSWGGWLHWMTRNRFPGQFFGFGLSDQVDRVRIFLELLERQFYRWGYILGWIGAWELLRSSKQAPLAGEARRGTLRGTEPFAFLALAMLGIAVFGMNYGGVTFRIYLIPAYLIFAVFAGCAMGALLDLVRGWPRGLAVAASTGLAVLFLALPLYPLWQNWNLVDESDNVYYRDMAAHFADTAGPDFVLVDSEVRYDDLEAILYEAWGARAWYTARWISPGEIDAWLGPRAVYAWEDGAAYLQGYVMESVAELPGMVRLTGVKDQ
jgi:hypothetical protein